MVEEDDIPQLSADTLGILQDFYKEKDAQEKAFEDLKAEADENFESKKQLSMDAFTEDWNASQFWYSDDTATKLARVLLQDATSDAMVAVVSAPSVFIQLKNLLAGRDAPSRPKLALLEFDERFEVFKEYVKYDYKQPMRLPIDLKGAFDIIICDPPFLSEDCQTKAALTIRWLAKDFKPIISEPLGGGLKLIVCTGERMEPLIHKLYAKAGVRTTNFEVLHSKGLSNEFRCYANFGSSLWTLP